MSPPKTPVRFFAVGKPIALSEKIGSLYRAKAGRQTGGGAVNAFRIYYTIKQAVLQLIFSRICDFLVQSGKKTAPPPFSILYKETEAKAALPGGGAAFAGRFVICCGDNREIMTIIYENVTITLKIVLNRK